MLAQSSEPKEAASEQYFPFATFYPLVQRRSWALGFLLPVWSAEKYSIVETLLEMRSRKLYANVRYEDD